MDRDPDLCGLSSEEAARRLAQVGPNALPDPAPTPLWRRFVQQLRSPLIYILIFALGFDLVAWAYEGAHGLPVEAFIIGLVLSLNSALGAYQEYRSEEALAKLNKLAASQVWAMRDRRLVRVDATALVPGDVVRIEAGDRIPADGVTARAEGFMVDESVLTGESMPVDRERGKDVLSGTLAVRGSAWFEVTATGRSSNMGRLAAMLGGIEVGKTPLERRLDDFAKQVARAVGVLAAVLIVAGVIADGVAHLDEVFLFAVALAVAAVPEGLPAVVTMTLALGVQRMAGRNAVVRRLSAVEALGSVTVIATDKTGTLTENRMTVRSMVTDDPAATLGALVLANDADHRTRAGDPLELGLLDWAVSQGLDPESHRDAHPRVGVRPFDSAWKYMRVTVHRRGAPVSYLKGAPEVILERAAMSAAEREDWYRRGQQGAAEGFRVIAVAEAEGERETELRMLGLVMIWDPPRPEVPDAIGQARAAGVRVVMITGDHPATAQAVARTVGIEASGVATGAEVQLASDDELLALARTRSVFARVSPEDKLRIVEALKRSGEIVAVTGDGVNDAPALRRADVGVAMGQRGSDVAREVADLVLLDDNFASIVAAIEEGRGIYQNIQKFVRFMFSTNLALVVLVVAGAVGSYLLGLRDSAGSLLLPLTATQLLWINFFGDGPPALALGVDRNQGVMEVPPRAPSSALLDAPSVRFVVSAGLLKALAGGVLLLGLPALGYAREATRTGVFLFESVSQIAFVYPSRRVGRRGPVMNRVLLVAVVGGVALQLTTLFVAPLRSLLGLVALDLRAIGIVALITVGTWIAAELANALIVRRAGGGRRP